MRSPLALALVAPFASLLFMVSIVLPDDSAATSECFDYGGTPVLIDGVGWGSRARGLEVRGDFAYVVDEPGGLHIVDISDPADLRSVGFVETPGTTYGVAVVGDYAYVADEDAGMQVVDVSDPQAPEIVFNSPVSRGAWGVWAMDGLVFLADAGTLRVFDVSEPASPRLTTTIGLSSPAQGVAAIGGHYFVTTGTTGVTVLTRGLATPTRLGEWRTQDYAIGVDVLGDLLVVADRRSGLSLYDVDHPLLPRLVGTAPVPDSAMDLEVVGDRAYVAARDAGIQIVDLSVPQSPLRIAGASAPGALNFAASDVVVVGTTAFLACEYSGLVSADVTEETTPDSLPPVESGGDAEAIAAFAGGAVVGNRYKGIAVFGDDAEGPRLLATLEVPGNSRDIVVRGDVAYVAGWDSGVKAVSLADPTAPQVIAETANMMAIDQVLRDDRLYVVSATTLEVFDVSDPGRIEAVESVDLGDHASSILIARTDDHLIVGREYYNQSPPYRHLRILDLVDPDRPGLAGFIELPGELLTALAASGHYVFVATNRMDLRVYDIASPSAPVLLGEIDTPIIVRSLMVQDGLLYATAGRAGMVVFDISTPGAPAVIGQDRTPDFAYSAARVGDRLWMATNRAGVSVRPLHCTELIVSIDDPIDGGAGDPRDETRARLRIESGNPMVSELRVMCAVPRAMNVDVGVFDLRGRRVASLTRGWLPAGPHALSWSGDDARGRRVSAGVYLVRMVGDRTYGSERFVLLR